MALTLAGADDGTIRTMLLADLRGLFAAVPPDPDADPPVIGRAARDVLFTSEILAELHGRDDRPWPEFGRQAKPITGRQLAALLKPLGIATKHDVRRGKDHGKGYRAADFADAWKRYLDPVSMGDRVTTRGNAGDLVPPIGDKAGLDVTHPTPQKASETAACHPVTDEIPLPNGDDGGDPAWPVRERF